MEEGYKLWQVFKKKLITSLKADPEGLLQSWGSKANRTEYYFKNLLPKIAFEMGYSFKSEKPLRVDGLFYKTASQSTPIPYIVIESENNIHSSSEEIEKLCFISAPLKVLFVVNEWNDILSKKIASEYWEYIIGDFAQAGEIDRNNSNYYCLLG